MGFSATISKQHYFELCDQIYFFAFWTLVLSV